MSGLAGSSAKSGQRLGRYRLGPRLAVGGMAEVFIARDDEGRDVVLKVLLPQLQRDESFVSMLEDEAALTERLEHHNLVRTLDHSSGSPSYLVMERVDGCTLSELLEHRHGEALAPALALRIGEALLEALAYIHAFCGESGRCLDIVHRDISPGNVLLGRDGAIKLADFGIARSLLRDKRTRTGVIKGTVQYMSPEQVAGSDIDRRADLYSVGLLLFEMLSGERYIEAEREIELLSKAAEPTWRAPSSVNHALSKSIDKLLRPALMVYPEQRYRDANAMLDKLRATAAELGVALASGAEVGAAVAPVCAKLNKPSGEMIAAAAPAAGDDDEDGDLDDDDANSPALANTLVQQRQTDRVTPVARPAEREGPASRAPLVAIALVGAAVVAVMVWRVGGRQQQQQQRGRVALVVDATAAKVMHAPLAGDGAPPGNTRLLAATPSDARTTTRDASAATTATPDQGARVATASKRPHTKRHKAPPRRHTKRRAGAASGSASGSSNSSNSSAAAAAAAAAREAKAAKLAAFGRRLVAADAALSAKGLAGHDLPASARSAKNAARSAIARRDDSAAAKHTAAYERAVATARLDRALVNAKLKRVERALRAAKSRADAASLRRRASAALQLLMDGRLSKANQQLDRLLGILRRP
ncbi:MAG: serine/threonine protein kinase [Myxococcales bacterium]|nr:serine/threonine protein kinase [Myxococcales bacterium]